ncbi:MAG: dockerin type I repeat-containing protein [Lachnospiraceae bacterium]|nr:dockerin type I repeat-containing protein [Lachnospiraceae bacterium]MBR1853862.1 dockerin type I repeat-containing protein [Lachnospiraceae bacterium]
MRRGKRILAVVLSAAMLAAPINSTNLGMVYAQENTGDSVSEPGGQVSESITAEGFEQVSGNDIGTYANTGSSEVSNDRESSTGFMVADVNITSNQNQNVYLAPEKPVWSAETPGMVIGKGAEAQPLYYQMIIYQDGTRVSSNKLGKKSGEWESTQEFRKAFLKSGTYTAQVFGFETDSYTDAVTESELSDPFEYVLPDVQLDTPSNLKWVIEDGKYTATCDAVANAARYTFTLYQDGEKIATFARSSSDADCTQYLTDIDAHNYTFDVLAIPEKIVEYRSSEKSELSDALEIPAEIDNNLRVTAEDGATNTSTVYVEPGGKATLKVNVSAVDTEGVTYRWYDQEKGMAIIEEATGASCETEAIYGIKHYSCRVTDKYGNEGTIYFCICVDNQLSARAKDDNSHIDVEVNEKVTLSVEADAADKEGITYQWYKIEYMPYYNRTLLGGATDSTYETESAGKSTTYRCELKDKYGNQTSVDFYLRIDNQLKASAENGDSTVVVEPNGKAVLSVDVSALDMEGITYTWYEHVKDSDYYSYRNQLIEEAAGNSYKTGEINHSTDYHCNVEDKYGNCWTVYFNVVVDNDFDLWSEDGEQYSKYVYVPLNSKATLNVKATAKDTEGITYQWYESNTGREITNATSASYKTGDISQAKNYSCIATDKYGTEKRMDFYIKVDNGFTVTTEHGNTYYTYSVAPNQTKILKVIASANDMDGITYKWYKEGTILKNVNQDTCETEAVSKQTYYRCEVTDKYGTTISVDFYIYVDNALSVTAENGYPYFTTSNGILVEKGDKVTMTVSATAVDTEGITYQWYRYSDGSEIKNATASTYETEEMEAAAGYYCQVKDKYGNFRNVYFYIKLDNKLSAVAEGAESYNPTGRTFTIKPGETASLKVVAKADDMDGITYTWSKVVYKDNVGTPTVISDAEGDTYETKESGTYYCYVKDKYGSTASVSFSVGVDNQLQPMTWNHTKSVKLNESVTLKAEVTATDMTDMQYQWYKIVERPSQGGGYVGETVRMDGETASVCQVENVDHRQNYQCWVTDRYGNRISLHFGICIDNGLAVYGLDKNGKKNSYSVQYMQEYNQKAALKVVVDADDTTGLTYEWSKREPGSYYFTADESVTENTYITDEITAAQDYYCVVTDRFGNSSTLYFYVKIDNGLKVNAVGNVEVAVKYNDPVKLQVAVEAKDLEGITYSWGGYSNSDICEVPNVKKARSYTCTVTDKFGNTAAITFNVSVQNHLQVKALSATEFTVKPGEEITFEVSASADDENNLQYYWSMDDTVTSNICTVTAREYYSTYRCTVVDKYGNTEVIKFYVFIDNDFKAEAIGDVHKSIKQGEDVELAVSASAADESDMTYQWYKRVYDNQISNYVNQPITEALKDNSTYTVTSEELGNSVKAEYFCRVRDKFINPIKVDFTVNVVTDAITKAAKTDITTETVDTVLGDLMNKSNEQLVAELQETEAVKALDTIEETYKEAHDITEKAPESAVTEIPADKIEMIGAALNVGDTETGTTVALKIDQTEELPEIDETDFKVKNMIVFDMSVVAKKADGTDADVDFSKELAIPVTVTLPVPAKINIDTVKIFHQQSDGTMEEVDAKIDKANRTATFTVTHFSLFAFVDELLAQLGDINGDGDINAKDRMYLARALAGWDGYAVPGVELADFNGDGEVNAKDRMYLARKLAGWEGYE